MSEDNPLVGEAAKAGHPVEVHAVGAMNGAGRMMGPKLAQRINDAMVAAVLECNEEGLSTQDHPDAIRERMLAARERVKVEAAAEWEAFIAQQQAEQEAAAKAADDELKAQRALAEEEAK